MTSKRERFTIWMKSLVMQGNGCTAYDENGEIVYRVENYDNKHSHEVYHMDLRGKVLHVYSVSRKCAFSDLIGRLMSPTTALTRHFFGSTSMLSHGSCYILEGLATGNSTFRIRDSYGGVGAEAKQKQSSSGVEFGDDILSLVVEPHVDHSFIMALVTVYGLINHQI